MPVVAIVNTTSRPATYVLLALGEVVKEEMAMVGAAMLRFEPLSGLVVDGALATTRIRYAVPLATVEGNVALIVPAAVAVRVPIEVGVVKLPLPSLNCAVKMLPDVNLPVMVKLTCSWPSG